MSISIANHQYTRRRWGQAVCAGLTVLGFGLFRHAGNVSRAREHERELAFSQPMKIKSDWGKTALTHVLQGDNSAPCDPEKDGMDYLMMKYGSRHINTIDVRNTEIAGRIIESNIGTEIRKQFPGINDGILVFCLKNIIRHDEDRQLYEIQGTSLSEGYAQKCIENLSSMRIDELCLAINIEFRKSYNDPFGTLATKRN